MTDKMTGNMLKSKMDPNLDGTCVLLQVSILNVRATLVILWLLLMAAIQES